MELPTHLWFQNIKCGESSKINPAAGDSRSPIGVEDKLCGSDGLGDFLRDHQI